MPQYRLRIRDPEKFDRIAIVVRLPRWRNRSNLAIGNFMGIDQRTIGQVRKEIGCLPTVIETKTRHGTMRTMRRSACGTGNRFRAGAGKKLTEAQARRMEEAFYLVEKYAKAKANEVLNRMELESVATEALVVASRYWRSTHKVSFINYARQGIWRAFNRAFKKARTRAQREFVVAPVESDNQNLMVESIFADKSEDHQGLMFELLQLQGVSRLLVEWVSGLDPSQVKWEAADIVKFFDDERMDLKRVTAMIEEAKLQLAGAA